MTDITPLPCPFCGSTKIGTDEGSTFRWMVAYCQECGGQSGEVRVQTVGEGTREEWQDRCRADALREWNIRAMP